LARTLEDAGVAAIFVHGRTREQGFAGTVNLKGIRSVVQAVKSIPVIGNGDVTTPEAAAMMFEETGCAGVSIGRGAFYNPWIFLHTREFLQMGVVPPEPSFEERIRVMCRHLDLMVEIFGEVLGCRMFRKVAPWYSKRFGPANEFNKKVVQVSSKAEFHKLLENYLRWRQQFLDLDGNLKPNYRPPPMVPSFMQEPAVAERTQIPVPKGPVEVW
jgi:tRNA-dihydrouridine synthase